MHFLLNQASQGLLTDGTPTRIVAMRNHIYAINGVVKFREPWSKSVKIMFVQTLTSLWVACFKTTCPKCKH